MGASSAAGAAAAAAAGAAAQGSAEAVMDAAMSDGVRSARQALHSNDGFECGATDWRGADAAADAVSSVDALALAADADGVCEADGADCVG